jgi:uncharacterized protein (TIGR00369 family)
MTGLEYLRSLDAESSAPIATTLGFSLVLVEEGRVAFELTPTRAHENPMGTLHGGVMATLLDSAAGASVHSKLPAGAAYTTLEIKVIFHRAATAATGRLRAEGRVISFGSRVAAAEASLRDAEGTLYASATSTCLILSPR